MNKNLILAIFISLFSAIPAGALTITFDIKDTFIEVGESFEVDVFAQEDISKGDLYLFGFDVDPLASLSLYTLDSYSVGSLFFDEGDGSLYVAGSTFDPNAGTNIHLATLLFTAGGVDGTQSLFTFGDPNNPPFDRGAYFSNLTTFQDFDLTISEDIDITIHKATAPEPTSFLLFGIGILGLSFLGKRKHHTTGNHDSAKNIL